MNENEERWRWLLVDSLAHGQEWCNYDGNLFGGRSEFERKQIARELAEPMVKLKWFGPDESRHIMTTPRFEISGSFKWPEDVPANTGTYLKSLPSLSVPFGEFWTEYALANGALAADSSQVYDIRCATRVARTEERKDGSFTLELATFCRIQRADYSVIRVAVVCSKLEVDADFKAVGLRTEHKGNEVLALPSIFAMALLGCGNISTVEVNPTRQVRRSTERTNGVALCSYRVIKLSPSKNRPASQQARKGTSHRALSICRGHFKTYDEHGLFGKKKGKWYWPDHARGDYENGVVVKDYEMVAS